MTPIYAGIGARATPPAVLERMTVMAAWLARRGWRLRTGGAQGADDAFARGAPPARRVLFLPWPGYNGRSGDDCRFLPSDRLDALAPIAAALHPAWDRCSPAVRKLHARNAAILLGPDVGRPVPVRAAVCWTEGGRARGGTGMAVRIARAHGIPVLDMAVLEPRAVCERLEALRAGPARPPGAAPVERTHPPVVTSDRATRALYANPLRGSSASLRRRLAMPRSAGEPSDRGSALLGNPKRASAQRVSGRLCARTTRTAPRRWHSGRRGSVARACPNQTSRRDIDAPKDATSTQEIVMNAFHVIDTADTSMADAFARAGLDGDPFDVDTDIDDGDREPAHAASPTAAICEHARLHGATPGPDEPDNRPVWDRDEAIAGAEHAFHVLARAVAPDGTQLADERESLLWGFVNTFHAQVQRLDRAVDRLAPEMRDLERAQDGTEVKAWQLQRITERAHNLGDRRDAFENLRDFAADAYTAETGEQWRPRRGSHASQTARLTSAAIDARDFIRARKDRETRAHLPDGTLVAVAGGKEAEDANAIWTVLDRVRARHADMVLVHGGGPGAEKIAASWAERNQVHQIVCKPDWDRHGRAAPFRRNDDLLNLLPKGLVAFPGSGITENLVDKARQLGIPVHRVAA